MKTFQNFSEAKVKRTDLFQKVYNQIGQYSRNFSGTIMNEQRRSKTIRSEEEQTYAFQNFK